MSFDYITPSISKWKLDDLMKIIDGFEVDFANAVHHKLLVQQDYQTLLAQTVGKSIVTAREIVTLCAYGYPDGALALGRNLYEQMIILSFFEAHKKDENFQEYVNDFFLSYEVQRNKCLRDIHRYIPNKNIDALEAEAERFKKRTCKKIKGDYWWAGYETFTKLIEHVMHTQNDDSFREFLGIHYSRYKRACVALHASCLGNSIRIGNRKSYEVIDTMPSLCGQSSPLIYATVSLIAIFGYACTNFQINNVDHIDKLNELAILYQEQEKVDSKF